MSYADAEAILLLLMVVPASVYLWITVLVLVGYTDAGGNAFIRWASTWEKLPATGLLSDAAWVRGAFFLAAALSPVILIIRPGSPSSVAAAIAALVAEVLSRTAPVSPVRVGRPLTD